MHGDLSHFNILNNNEEPVFIDFSQGTVTQNNHAKELLERDIKNIVNFFNKKYNLNEDSNEIFEKIFKTKKDIR